MPIHLLSKMTQEEAKDTKSSPAKNVETKSDNKKKFKKKDTVTELMTRVRAHLLQLFAFVMVVLSLGHYTTVTT